ncbi:MAG: hypothetical protein J5J00_17235, partial [Deltaproteobacteria bacterium]|nr:hypothetical protein [Deltaproteobacteria bacterium]
MVQTKHDRKRPDVASHPGEQPSRDSQRPIHSRLSPHHTFAVPPGSNVPDRERNPLHHPNESPVASALDPDARAVLSYLK